MKQQSSDSDFAIRRADLDDDSKQALDRMYQLQGERLEAISKAKAAKAELFELHRKLLHAGFALSDQPQCW